MLISNTLIDLREAILDWQSVGERIAFIPTMGNLHAGHLKLVEEAKLSANRVVVSIFVNPTQFAVGEDFNAYPRTEAEDKQKLLTAGADLLFLPSISQMYNEDAKTNISVKGLSTIHCGLSRPGHFDGVATVVCKLFNMVQPDIAFFGQKDYQQLVIIRTMVRDLNIPVDIRSTSVIREKSGLAMSSRNGYLKPDEIQVAPLLYQTLCAARDQVLLDDQSFEEIETGAVTHLEAAGFIPDYICICKQDDLLKASRDDTNLVILAAAYLGRTRLIDNIIFSRTKSTTG